MKLIPDRTGRFPERPHYEIEELEEECERIMTTFLERRYGQMVIPVPTDALRVLIEGEAAKLLRADLSHEGEEVHGITEFFPGCKPWVSIARELSTQPWRVHRERTTLAHEYGHYADIGISPLCRLPDYAAFFTRSSAAHGARARDVGIIIALPGRRAVRRLGDSDRVTSATGCVFAIAFSFSSISAWTYICVLSTDSCPSQSAITVRSTPFWSSCIAAL